MSMHEVADNRARRRDLTCAATGLFAGGTLGTLTAVFVPVGGLILVLICAVVGRCGPHGRRAPHQRRRLGIAQSNGRTYVGTRCPDDDVTNPS